MAAGHRLDGRAERVEGPLPPTAPPEGEGYPKPLLPAAPRNADEMAGLAGLWGKGTASGGAAGHKKRMWGIESPEWKEWLSERVRESVREMARSE